MYEPSSTAHHGILKPTGEAPHNFSYGLDCVGPINRP